MVWTRTACVAAAAFWATGAGAAELALKRVTLSSGGVGLYEYEAEVEGDSTVELKVRLDQVDDVLKSLVVFDDHGGVGGLDLASAEPLAETFRSLPFNEADLQSTPQLLTALRGAEVEIGGPHTISGRIVAVTEETETKPDGGALGARHRVSVMSDKGLEQFVLEQAESVRFADPTVRDQIARALKRSPPAASGIPGCCGCCREVRTHASCTSPISPPRRSGRRPIGWCSIPRRRRPRGRCKAGRRSKICPGRTGRTSISRSSPAAP